MDPLVAAVHGQIRRDFGMLVPPFTLHDPAPPLLAGFWMVCREATVASRVPRAHTEAVATAISTLNRCPYCVDAHAMMLHGTGAHEAAQALAAGRAAGDPTLAALAVWAAASRRPGDPQLSRPPFAADAAPALVGTAVAFHYVNRMVSALLPDSPLPVRGERWKRPLRRLLGWHFGRAIRRAKTPGASLALLSDAPLPGDLAWATPDAAIAGAFARFAAAVEAAGAAALGDDARARIAAHVGAWHGADPPLGRGWLDDATADLPAAACAEARLGLVAALAPWQMDATLRDAYRATRPGDAGLVGALAWSAFTAARRIGTWLTPH